MMRTWITVVVLAAVVAAAGACGKKSRLTPPEDSTYPQQYPAEKKR